MGTMASAARTTFAIVLAPGLKICMHPALVHRALRSPRAVSRSNLDGHRLARRCLRLEVVVPERNERVHLRIISAEAAVGQPERRHLERTDLAIDAVTG